MFLLVIYGNIRIYSTKTLAEREASRWLLRFVLDNHWAWRGGEGSTACLRRKFERNFVQEKYSDCIVSWNDYVKKHLHSDYLVKIKEIELDQVLT